MMEVKQVGSYAGNPGLPARCKQAHSAGTGSFTPRRQNSTARGSFGSTSLSTWMRR